jgi:hypothetical protein
MVPSEKMKDIKQENTDKTINLIYFLINIYMPSDLINTNDTMTIFLLYSKKTISFLTDPQCQFKM